MKNTLTLAIATAIIAAIGMACNFSASTANIGSFKVAKDKEGKQAASTFKSGDTIYAIAEISASMSKTTVKFSMTADDAPGMKKGEEVPLNNPKVELPSSGTATYTLPVPAGMKGGKFTLTADMLNEAGEKKDTKSAAITIEGGSGSTSPATSKDDKAPSKDADKDDDN